MDIMLDGEMDGIEAASIIKKKLDIPIIYLTAFSDEQTLKRAKITEALDAGKSITEINRIGDPARAGLPPEYPPDNVFNH